MAVVKVNELDGFRVGQAVEYKRGSDSDWELGRIDTLDASRAEGLPYFVQDEGFGGCHWTKYVRAISAPQAAPRMQYRRHRANGTPDEWRDISTHPRVALVGWVSMEFREAPAHTAEEIVTELRAAEALDTLTPSLVRSILNGEF